MNKQRLSYQVAIRYSLFQLPGLILLVLIIVLLDSFMNIPEWIIWTSIAAWIVKDALMFPFVWRSYDKFSCDLLIGSYGKAVETLSPEGYVLVKGELWRAENTQNSPAINKGEIIIVTGSRGLTLLVRRPEDKHIEAEKN